MSKARSMMQPRLNYWSLAPAVPGKLLEATALVEACGLERALLHLVNIRASQVNGCAFCLELHTREAREDGESEERLYALSAWDDSPIFSARERAALAWTEAVTHVSAERVSESVWERVRPHFDEAELAWLTYAVALINTWNRLAIAFKPVPGSWKKPKAAASRQDR